MSANGHVLPDGATIATLEMLKQANTSYRKLPRASEQLGQDVVVRIRAVRPAVYMEFLPTLPSEAKDWPTETEARGKAYEAWLATQSPDAIAARTATVLRVSYRVIAAGVLEPVVTEETAPDFAGDADWLANEILIFSGILKPPAPVETEPVAA